MLKFKKEIITKTIATISLFSFLAFVIYYVSNFIEIYNGGFWAFFGSLILAFATVIKNLFWPYIYFCIFVLCCWVFYIIFLFFKNDKNNMEQNTNHPSD